jgi:hypothetical protein
MVFPHGQVAQYHPYNLLQYGTSRACPTWI